MTQGVCEKCNDYYKFVKGTKVVDVHRQRAKCPGCGEQLVTTTHQIKRVNRKFKYDVDRRTVVDVHHKGVDY